MINNHNKSLLRNKMIYCAKQGITIGYHELCKSIGLCINFENDADKSDLSTILGSISEEENLQGRPLLSVVVVKINKEPQMPGQGFFNMAKSQRKYNGSNNRDDQFVYFIKEFNAAKEYWKNN